LGISDLITPAATVSSTRKSSLWFNYLPTIFVVSGAILLLVPLIFSQPNK
jgi:hypothetical protein